jgi:hypothetical protein
LIGRGLRFLARRRALKLKDNALRSPAQRRLAARLKRTPGYSPDGAFKRIDEIRRDAPPETEAQRPEARLRSQSPEHRFVRNAHLDQHLRRRAAEARQCGKRRQIRAPVAHTRARLMEPFWALDHSQIRIRS